MGKSSLVIGWIALNPVSIPSFSSFAKEAAVLSRFFCESINAAIAAFSFASFREIGCSGASAQ